jgi:DNA repair protein RadA/Sms
LQALTAKSSSNFPRRVSVGMDLARLNMLLAVIENSLKINLFYDDVYLNIIGDIKPIGRGTDLPAILAIYSAKKGVEISKNIFIIGEVSLTGEIRFVSKIENLIREARRFGFKKIIIPEKNFRKLSVKLKEGIIPASNIIDAIKKALS